jgi:hypothetical protein
MVVFVPGSRTFVYAIVFLELGLIAVITAAVIRISLYEKQVHKDAELGNVYLVNVDTCPDYFANSMHTTTIPPTAKMVGLRSLNPDSARMYCSDNTDGVFCNSNTMEAKELFVMDTLSDPAPETVTTSNGITTLKKTVTFRGGKNNMFCGVASGSANQVICNSSKEEPGEYEKFILIEYKTGADAGKVQIKSVGTKKWCSSGTQGLMCNDVEQSTNAISNQKFLLEQMELSSNDIKKSGVRCSNGYTNPTGDRRYYFVRRGCNSSSNLNDASCLLDASKKNEDWTMDLKNYSGVTPVELCKMVNTSDSSKPFSSIPWTDVKAKCNSLSLGGVLSNDEVV